MAVALILYAVGGSPTPDQLSWIEISIALLLVQLLRWPRPADVMRPAGLFLMYGLSVPVISGLVKGHDPVAVLRDGIAFGFLCLPILMTQRLAPSGADAARWLSRLIVMIGVMFSVRTLWPYRENLLQPAAWLGQPPADLLYLANSPEVLFAAILLGGGGLYEVWRGRRTLLGLAMGALAALPLLAMAVMGQRAGLGCVALALTLLGVAGLWQKPGRTIMVGVMVAGLAVLGVTFLTSLVYGLIQKTELVGLNSRAQEWDAVLTILGQNPALTLFGTGWGASFENPAVAGLPVTFTHSLISSIWLKTGVIGLTLLAFYLLDLAKQAVPELWKRPVLALAMAAPLAVGLMLYASYKSLGFGLLLLLCASFFRIEKLDKNQRDMA